MIAYSDSLPYIYTDSWQAVQQAIEQMNKTVKYQLEQAAEIKWALSPLQALRQSILKTYAAKSSIYESIQPIRALYSNKALNQATTAEHVMWGKQADLYSKWAPFLWQKQGLVNANWSWFSAQNWPHSLLHNLPHNTIEGKHYDRHYSVSELMHQIPHIVSDSYLNHCTCCSPLCCCCGTKFRYNNKLHWHLEKCLRIKCYYMQTS